MVYRTEKDGSTIDTVYVLDSKKTKAKQLLYYRDEVKSVKSKSQTTTQCCECPGRYINTVQNKILSNS